MESIRRRLSNFAKGERNDWKDVFIEYSIILLPGIIVFSIIMILGM